MIFIADLIACSTCFEDHCAHHQELESIIQVVAACGIWCFGFQVVGMVWSWGLCVRFAGYMYGVKEAARQLPSHRKCSATLPLSEPLPTTTTGHYTICCKKSQSCAHEDGQKIARNMLSWSWTSIKLLLLHLYYFTYIKIKFWRQVLQCIVLC